MGFSSLQDMRGEASFRMFFEKVRLSKEKLETDDTKLPKKEKLRVISKEKYK